MSRYDLAVRVLFIGVALLLLKMCVPLAPRDHPIAPTRASVATDLPKYCLDNPKDSACQGPNSK